MKHVGLHANRLSVKADNPREVAFARQWRKENDWDKPGTQSSAGNILRTLIPDATQHDATVVATVMQWLGSNVGMSFLGDVIRASPDVTRWIRDILPADQKQPKVTP